ncbi:MAG: molybdenum cofactor biosynthesis protein MoaE [bacterium]
MSLISIELLYFASIRDVTGTGAEKLEIPSGSRIESLSDELTRKYPELSAKLPHARWAVNEEFVDCQKELAEGDRIAIIMPVSGGSGEPEIAPPELLIVELTNEVIDSSKLTERVTTAKCGAVCLFLGTVREFTGDRQTFDLVYEAYPEMATKELEKILREATTRWPIPRLGVIHRLGLVPLGEASIALTVATPHRQASFDACSWMMDEIKKRVPIWKQEHWGDGSTEWVHPGTEC